VVDTTVMIGWCFAEAAGSYVDAVLDGVRSRGAILPASWMVELGNVLLAAEARQRLSEADSFRFLHLLQALPLHLDCQLPSRHFGAVMALGRKYALSSAEAAYLELALREGTCLATMNQRLRQAALECHVPLFSEGRQLHESR